MHKAFSCMHWFFNALYQVMNMTVVFHSVPLVDITFDFFWFLWTFPFMNLTLIINKINVMCTEHLVACILMMLWRSWIAFEKRHKMFCFGKIILNIVVVWVLFSEISHHTHCNIFIDHLSSVRFNFFKWLDSHSSTTAYFLPENLLLFFRKLTL